MRVEQCELANHISRLYHFPNHSTCKLNYSDVQCSRVNLRIIFYDFLYILYIREIREESLDRDLQTFTLILYCD